MLLALVTTTAFSFFWESGLEEVFCQALGLGYDHQFEEWERFRFVATATAAAGVALIGPTILLMIAVTAANRGYARAERAARRDVLTDLPNRRAFMERLGLITEKRAPFALFLLDLDKFKLINDIWGHPAGDAALRATAARLVAIAGPDGFAARVGGDEFAIVLPGVTDEERANRLGDLVAVALAKAFEFEDREIGISATVGCSLAAAGAAVERTLRCADAALYEAKKEGGAGYCLFQQRMEDETRNRRALEDDIRAAVAAGQFRPYYQPLIDLKSERVQGFELLARWERPNIGTQSPAVFIAVAERIGVITDLTLGILRQACLEMRDWPGAPTMSVNISPSELQNPSLALRIVSILEETRFPPRRLEIEITEDALMDDLTAARAFVDSVRMAGMSVALDDFGAGYSNLSTLRAIRFDKIKIDRSFVTGAEDNDDARRLIEGIVTLGHGLGVVITAEGIETERTARYVTALGCEYGQGYHFGRPSSGRDAIAYLRSGRFAGDRRDVA